MNRSAFYWIPRSRLVGGSLTIARRIRLIGLLLAGVRWNRRGGV